MPKHRFHAATGLLPTYVAGPARASFRMHDDVTSVTRRCFAAIGIVLVAAGMFACSAAQDTLPAKTQPDAACKNSDIRARCLLSDAERSLVSIEDDFAWSTSAAELAVAYDAHNDLERATALMSTATERAARIADPGNQVLAYVDIATGLAQMSPTEIGRNILSSIDTNSAKLTDVDQRAKILGKVVTARASQDRAERALDEALNLPESEGYQAVFKALALRNIAEKLAGKGNFKLAAKAARSASMSMDYYQSTARSDVARVAALATETDIATAMLEEALPIAKGIEDGYFGAAALRDIAVSYYYLGDAARSMAIFEQAGLATANAKTPNEQARSMSRIATRMADIGFYEPAEVVIARSIEYAVVIESEATRNYTNYEIAGAASFSGYFDIARTLIENLPDKRFGATESIRAAAERDLAWGLAKHDKLSEAILLCSAIRSPRERIQALSRIARLIGNPSMSALPRYL